MQKIAMLVSVMAMVSGPTLTSAQDDVSIRDQRHQKAVEEIDRHGGQYHPSFPPGNANSSLANLQEWKGNNYGQLSELKKVDMLWLPPVSDEDLEEINIPELRVLRLTGGSVSDQGFADFIVRHSKLERVSMIGLRELSDDGLASLGQLKHLRDIEMVQIPLTNASLKKLSNGLRMLSIRDGKITANCINDIIRLKDIESLYVHNVSFTDNDMKQLSNLTQLQTLIIKDSELTNDGLAYISNLKSLHALSIGGSKVTDNGLKHLQHLKRLNRFFPHNTQCTREGLRHLQQSIWKTEENARQNNVLFALMNNE